MAEKWKAYETRVISVVGNGTRGATAAGIAEERQKTASPCGPKAGGGTLVASGSGSAPYREVAGGEPRSGEVAGRRN